MDFPTEFIALRDRIQKMQFKEFETQENAMVGGRMAALFSTFGLSEERKILGLMPTGGATHAHEYRLLFAAPALDEAGLDDWFAYIGRLEQELVEPDAAHDFSLISLLLVCDEVAKPLQKKVRKFAHETRYARPQAGWSSARVALIDLGARKIYTNHFGDSLKNVIAPVL